MRGAVRRAAPQVFHEWNTVVHVTDYEGAAGRRPLTYDEVQALFDAADARVEEIRRRGRKGALAAMRDAALLKTVYAFGLRRREASGLDLADFRHNPKAPQFGRFGGLFVRYGKASRGRPAPAAHRADRPGDGLDHRGAGALGQEVRPVLGPGSHPALWVTERARPHLGARRRRRRSRRLAAAAGLPAELDLHCLRHSYITHLVEFDYPERFVSEQVGHRMPRRRRSTPGCQMITATGCCAGRWNATAELWEDET